MTEDEMVGWHHQLDGHEFEEAPGVGDGQGGLECCSPWGCKESDMTATELTIPLCVYMVFPLSIDSFTEVSLAYASWLGFPGGTNGKDPTCKCRRRNRCRFDPWVGKIPWRREQQPTPVFLPGESHGQRSLVSYSPRGCKESDTTEQLSKAQ